MVEVHVNPKGFAGPHPPPGTSPKSGSVSFVVEIHFGIRSVPKPLCFKPPKATKLAVLGLLNGVGAISTKQDTLPVDRR